MSQYTKDNPATSSTSSRSAGRSMVWVGWIAFAGTMMILLGALHIFQGLVALFNDEYYLVGRTGLVLSLDFTVWGWAHIVGGAVVLFAGAGVLQGKVWARSVGVAVALLSVLANVAFLAAYPVWSLIMIAVDIFVILALTVHGSDVRDDEVV